MIKVIIGSKVFIMKRYELKLLLDKFKHDRKIGIMAIEKDKTVEMRKDSFNNKQELNNKIREYRALGYKVYSILEGKVSII